MIKVVYEEKDSKIQVALTESSKTLEQILFIWCIKGEKKSTSFSFKRSEIECAHALKLERLIFDWGLSKEQYLTIKNEIMAYMEKCKEIECEEEGPDVNSMVNDIAEILKKKIDSGCKEITFDEQYIYVEPAYFRELVKEFGEYGYTDRDILRELKHSHYLKPNDGRNTYQHRVAGEQMRHIRISRTGCFEKILGREEA